MRDIILSALGIVPVVGVIVLALFLVRRQTQQLQTGAANGVDQTAGRVAQRMGLALVEGDPSLNFLYMFQPGGDFERRIRMQGAPYGRPVDFAFTEKQETAYPASGVPSTGSGGLAHADIDYSFYGSITLDVGAEFPEFELTLLNPNQYLRPSRVLEAHPEIPRVSLGAPHLDAAFYLVARDPRVGVVIAHAVAPFARQGFVHVLGRDRKLRMLITRYGLPYFAHAAEEYSYVLESIACALEGRAQHAPPLLASMQPQQTPA